MDEDIDQGSLGSEEQSATGAEQAATEQPKSINSQAKDLPWVKDLMQSKAELEQLKTQIAESEQTAERKRAEAEGDYKAALEMETTKRQELEAKYGKEIRDLTLKSELVTAGFRPEALKVLADQYNQDEQSAADFAAQMKSSEDNSWLLLAEQQQRQAAGTPASGIGSGSKYDPSWISSSDPKKRAIAIQKNRSRIFGR